MVAVLHDLLKMGGHEQKELHQKQMYVKRSEEMELDLILILHTVMMGTILMEMVEVHYEALNQNGNVQEEILHKKIHELKLLIKVWKL